MTKERKRANTKVEWIRLMGNATNIKIGMPCLREVFSPWQLFTFNTHDAVGTIFIVHVRDFLLLFLWFAIKWRGKEIKNERKMAGFVHGIKYMREIFWLFKEEMDGGKKVMQRMLEFIVRRVNKLISVDPCHSIVLNGIFFFHFF